MWFQDTTRTIDLSEAERGHIVDSLVNALAREPRVRTAFLFGSFATGSSFRDIDIGVEMKEPFSLLEVAGLSDRLWASVGRPSYDLHVVPLNGAPPAFRMEVDATGIVLHEASASDAIEFAVQARSEWIELKESLRAVALDQGG